MSISFYSILEITFSYGSTSVSVCERKRVRTPKKAKRYYMPSLMLLQFATFFSGQQSHTSTHTQTQIHAAKKDASETTTTSAGMHEHWTLF